MIAVVKAGLQMTYKGRLIFVTTVILFGQVEQTMPLAKEWYLSHKLSQFGVKTN